MKTIIMGMAAGLLALGTLAYYLWPLPPERLFDADRNALAMSYQEGYCSGVAYMETGGQGSSREFGKCIKDKPRMSSKRDLSVVIRGFCFGARDRGWTGNITEECIEVIELRKMWPTLEGQLSVAFKGKYRWPGEVFPGMLTDDGTGGRTGDREDTSRDGFTR